MKPVARIILAALAATTLTAQSAPPPPAAPLAIMRLDCGTFVANDLDDFSDTGSMKGVSKPLTGSCYLIRHGADYLLWDTGLAAAAKGKPLDRNAAFDYTLDKTLVEQLFELGLKPEQIARVGISHYHFDHSGQAASFPQAILLIGKGDFDALKAGAPGANAKPLEHWVSGPGKVETVSGDKDVFGDGRVMILDLPGHTPGHHGLMVRLGGGRTLLLTGDLAHFRENYDSDGVPRFNTDRADTLASLDRFKKIAGVEGAAVIVQHDARDIGKLPPFGQWAE
ncbi:N-acyl homoserine lactonase family protein [Erythrobacter oryzae]|uniref:N-acyl homoserine lactonase family protein n=1 Tax=Erythrobacter oryzae TaxID=3019556 RepID=UPI0025524412|nr:N-acyl homoserine lactonase family protein [Erythrobacter sp. COR-2]